MAVRSEVLEFVVQGELYKCPPTPPLKEIRRSSKKSEEQVYVRDLSYEQWDWELEQSEWLPEQTEWYEDEIIRLHTGSWIMINGEPVYFNKYAHFFHQWWVLLSGKRPDYKDTSLEYFRFFEICEKDRFCFGDCGIKGRRVGLSSMSASIKVLIGILESNTLSGIVSKTGTDAYEMYLMAKNGIENLPRFITPEIASVTEGEIHIAKQTPRISKNNKFLSADKGKNNRLNWLDTSDTAYDGRAMRHITIDEAGKWKRNNVRKCFGKISDTLIIGATMVGKVSVFSTVDKGDEGGDNFREIWDGSDHINGKKDVYGRTKTKLKRFFLPAYRGYLGYIGKYGESIIENPNEQQMEWLKTHEYFNEVSQLWEKAPDPFIGAKQWLQVTRDMLADDPEALAEEKRKNPFDWKEVFEGSNGKCHFRNPQEINNQIERIKSRIEMGAFYRRGWFTKQDPTDENEMPVFKDSPNGMWYILDMLTPDQACKQVWKNGQRTPNNTEYGGAGVDTFSNSEATAEKGSDAAMCVFKRYNILDSENSGMPTALFIGRPDTKLQFHQQIFWGACHWGIKMLIERSPTDWYDYAEKQKILGYCLKTTLKINGKEVYGVAPQDTEGREQHLTEMVEWVDTNIEKLWFLRIAEDLIPFNVKDRTQFDGGMCFGYALMACREKYRPIVAPENDAQIIRIYNLREKYNLRR
jgi:hypothetical protein